MKEKLIDMLSLAVMCLAFVLVIKLLVLVKGGVISHEANMLSGLVKALVIR